MRHVVPGVLLIIAAIHALPLAGVLGGESLVRLYGVDAGGPEVQILLRHRAVLFGILAGVLTYAAFRAELQRLALLAGLLSASSRPWFART